MAVNQLKSLKGKENFSFIYNNGIRCYDKNSLAIFRKREPSVEDQTAKDRVIYLGVVVGKRTSKKAVVRNRLKRLMRESVRQSLKELEGTLPADTIESMVFIWRKAPVHPMAVRLSRVKPEIMNLLKCFLAGQCSQTREKEG